MGSDYFAAHWPSGLSHLHFYEETCNLMINSCNKYERVIGNVIFYSHFNIILISTLCCVQIKRHIFTMCLILLRGLTTKIIYYMCRIGVMLCYGMWGLANSHSKHLWALYQQILSAYPVSCPCWNISLHTNASTTHLTVLRNYPVTHWLVPQNTDVELWRQPHKTWSTHHHVKMWRNGQPHL